MARFKLRPVFFVCLYGFVAMTMAAVSIPKPQRSTKGSAAASFSEGEEGQMTVLTRRGVPVKKYKLKHQEQEGKDGEDADPKEWNALYRQQLKAKKRRNRLRKNRSRRPEILSRRKRFSETDPSYTWPKGIVPYDFELGVISPYYINEALAAMTRWHKYTCLRFVPWVKGETMQKYGLTEESHVTITRGSTCSATQGNVHSTSGQYNSCCNRASCTHELGHTLGLYHEHQSPWRGQFVNMITDRISGAFQWTFRIKYESDVDVHQYDITSTMHYSSDAFIVMYEELKPLLKFNNQYYMYKDASIFHSCKELFCSNYTGPCQNDGFVTVVDDQCSCLCPPGLDSSTNCATTVKQVSTSTEWPSGSFATFSSILGCPGSEFQEGFWQHQGDGTNGKSDSLLLGGTFDKSIFRYKFCVREDNSGSGSDSVDWEPGQYCVLRVNGACPKGFEAGFIQFDDLANSTGNPSGRLPDGQFVDHGDTRLEFCCRNDGFTSTPLHGLPSTKPFVMMYHINATSCQEVAGMRWTEQFMWFGSLRGTAAMSGSHAYVTPNSFFKIWFCHYDPVDYNCGGEITLTRNNRNAVIKSPNFPSPYGTNLECNWIVKAAEEGGQVMVNFDEFKVTGMDDSCQDSLELRYNLPGQPGVRYCGDGFARTIRSINDSIILTLRSDRNMVTSDIGFNLTATLYWPEEDGCYEPSTRGTLYRGQKNYTRGMKACLPWAEVSQCQYHAFHPRDFGLGLEENYCRNPDNTPMPWCYVDEECNRDFCDVCNVERIYDRAALCPTTVCQKTQSDIVKLGCAHTCGLQPPPPPNKDVKCGIPERPVDARFGDSTPCINTTNSVGKRVSLQCTSGPEFLNITCLSDGQWSPNGYVCGGCAEGWAFFNGHCYKHFREKMTFPDARKFCASYGGLVASMKNREEMDFVSSLRLHAWVMWLGATAGDDNIFRWEDGAALDWTNWGSDATPDNPGGEKCVEVYTEYYNTTWENEECDDQYPFICKYPLSARTHCSDRHRDCRSMLLAYPEACSNQKVDFANQMCPYSCGQCLADSTPKCSVPAITDATVVGGNGQTLVTRGSVVQYACGKGLVLTQGQLALVCGADGQLIGTLPVCTDPDTIIQDSNDVDVVPRSKNFDARHAYTSLGANLGITRNGAIKQWNFYSNQKGFTFFQVWRPYPAWGNLSFTLVGQNQVETKGVGEETYDVEEADWIMVQPGDRIGIFETEDYRGYVPYSDCENSSRPGDYGVTFSLESRAYGDFSPSMVFNFSSKVSCKVFSFKAVVHPESSVSLGPDRASSQVALLPRLSFGARSTVYLGDSANFHIPVNGQVKEWQFYCTKGGTGAFQVWRRQGDKGSRKFKLIGQNKVNVTSNTPGFRTLQVPQGERIAVQAGDIISYLYGPDNKMDIPYTICSETEYPESGNISWFEPLTPDTVFIGDVYSFSYTSNLQCRIFSFRAFVEEEQTTPKPEPPILSTSEVPIISRPTVGTSNSVYLGDSDNYYVPTDGHIQEWEFFSKYPGSGAFQVWRRWKNEGDRLYQLIGQNTISITTNAASAHSYRVPEGERIAVKAGDIIGFLYGPSGDRLGLPYSLCDSANDTDSNNIYWYEPLSTQTAAVGDVYKFDFTGGIYLCRVFSFRAIIDPEVPVPGLPDLRTSDVSLIDRSSVGSVKNVYLGDSNNFYIPADGYVKEWQFFTKAGGTGAFQVWRREAGERKYRLIGQNKINITSNNAQTYVYTLPEKDKIPVQAGDIIGFLYGEDKLDIPYSLCENANNNDSNNVYWYDSITPDSAIIGEVYQFSYSGGSYLCRIFSFRAVVEQVPPTPVPTLPDLRTSDLALVPRSGGGSAQNVYLGDSNNYYIPANGYVKEWQFFSENAGSGAFQVWRRRSDKGIRQFQLIGQNAINLTSDEHRVYSFPVPEGERIAVQAGDIIGFLYGQNPLGIPYTLCDDANDPDYTNIFWYEPLTPDSALIGDIYQFGYSGGSYFCRIFSFRAVVQQSQVTPAPSVPDLATSDIALISRSIVGASRNAYLGDSGNYHIPADGTVTEWRFFSKYAGSGAFQVWRRRADQGVRKYELIGQNPINLTTTEAGSYRLSVPEGERITVKSGDIIGFLYGESKMGLPYSLCDDVNDPDNNNAYWYEPLTPESAAIGQVYGFSYSGGAYLCRIFSFKAIVKPAGSGTP